MSESAPLTCTQSADEVAEIGRLLVSLGSHSLVPVERTQDGYRLRLARSEHTEGLLREFVRRDKACCSFLEFEVIEDPDELRLEITGPTEAQQTLDLCVAVAQSTERRS